VNAAMREAEAADVRGAEVTPFLLAAVSRMTAGGALRANLALLENNAFLAGQIAGALKPDAGGTTS
jgi:pseudouridine-5'-phosphate glycosidase